MTDVTGWPSAPVAEAPEVSELTEEQKAAQRAEADLKVKQWLGAKANLTGWKDSEGALRAEVTNFFFPKPKKGTQYFTLDAAGYKLKLVHGLNYKIGDADKTTEEGIKIPIRRQITELEEKIMAVGPRGELLVNRLFKWSAELSATEYEALDPEEPEELAIRNLIAEVLTVSPKSPTLEFVPPKPPKE